MRYLIFQKKHSQLFSSHHLFLGTMMCAYPKKALPTSSNQQDHRIHGGSKNARLPHRSHWKCWRKGSPQRHRVKISRLSQLEVHPMPPKRFAKVIAPGDFFQPQWRTRTKTWANGVSFWSPMKRGAAIISRVPCQRLCCYRSAQVLWRECLFLRLFHFWSDYLRQTERHALAKEAWNTLQSRFPLSNFSLQACNPRDISSFAWELEGGLKQLHVQQLGFLTPKRASDTVGQNLAPIGRHTILHHTRGSCIPLWLVQDFKHQEHQEPYDLQTLPPSPFNFFQQHPINLSSISQSSRFAAATQTKAARNLCTWPIEIHIHVQYIYPMVRQHCNGKSPYAVGNIPTNGGCSIAVRLPEESPVNIYIYSISRCIFYSSICFLIYLLSHIFIYLLFYLFIYSFVYIFVSSFIHSFIRASLLIFKLFIYSIIFHLSITSSKKCFWERSLSTNLYLPTTQCQCQAMLVKQSFP